MPKPFIDDRDFILVWKVRDVGRLRSIGSREMFWETFVLEPLGLPLAACLEDRDAWGLCEFALRHERTGAVLDKVFSPGGATPDPPPSVATSTRPSCVTLRGTYCFRPSAPVSRTKPWWRFW